MTSVRCKFETFATFHKVPKDEWEEVYESGLDNNRDWEDLMNSVVYCPKANYHLFADITYDMQNEEHEINRRIKSGIIDKSVFKRGDIIQCYGDNEDRNVGKLIWNGKKAVRFDGHSLTDYGTIPFEFAVGREFSVNYWNDRKLQNYMNAVPVNFGKRISKQLDKFVERHIASDSESDIDDEIQYDFVFTFQGQKWMYNYDPDSEDRPFDENGKGHVLYEELGTHIMGHWYHLSEFYKSFIDYEKPSEVPPENVLVRYSN